MARRLARLTCYQWAALVAVAAAMLAPPATAEPNHNSLFLNSTVVGGVSNLYTGCINGNAYAMKETPAPDGKAYFGSAAPGPCSIEFTFVPKTNMVLTGTKTLVFSTSCDRPTTYGMPTSTAFVLIPYRGSQRAGAQVNIGAGGRPCQGPTDVASWTASLAESSDLNVSSATGITLSSADLASTPRTRAFPTCLSWLGRPIRESSPRPEWTSKPPQGRSSST